VLSIGVMDEKTVIRDALGFLSNRFDAEISLFGEEDPQRYDPKGRATIAIPRQPAVFIE